MRYFCEKKNTTIMKRTLSIIGLALLSAVVGAVAAVYVVGNKGTEDVQIVETIVERTPSLGAHFTSYEQGNYPDLTYAAENAVKAVVNIEVISEVAVPNGYNPFFEFFGIPQQPGGTRKHQQRSGGSGVIISTDGYIVTNNHVVENSTKLRVKLNDGRTFDARRIGTDPATDVALIKIEGENLPTLAFGSSDALRLGEWVLAIGSPFDLQSTITAGIVSAKARQLDVIPDDFRIESFIQTDAAVNPGNSGGALVNVRGELVGINTVIKSSTGSYIGYSFAVPETIVRKVVDDLKEYGVVQRALLGVSYQYIDQDFIDRMGEQTGIKSVGGAYVASVVEGGAASEAGLRKGDVIISIDGVAIDAPSKLGEQIGKHRPNDKVKISVKRGENVKHFEATLRNKAGKAELLAADAVDVAKVLGGRFVEADSRLCKKLDIRSGIEVVQVNADGLLARARVRAGFVITHINDKAISTIADLNAITDKVRSIDGVYPDGRAASYMVVE